MKLKIIKQKSIILLFVLIKVDKGKRGGGPSKKLDKKILYLNIIKSEIPYMEYRNISSKLTNIKFWGK